MMRTPLPVGRGRDPSPLTPEVVRVLKMATPYVTDETGGECGNRGAASPGILGLGVRTWKRVCATPIPGLLLCHAPVPPSPFIPFGLLPAPPSGLVFGGVSLLPVSPNLGSFDVPCSGTLRSFKLFLAVGVPYLFRVLLHYGLLHCQFPPIPTLFPPPPSPTVKPALCPSPFSFFFSELYLMMISLLHSAFLTLCPIFICWGWGGVSLKYRGVKGRGIEEFNFQHLSHWWSFAFKVGENKQESNDWPFSQHL